VGAVRAAPADVVVSVVLTSTISVLGRVSLIVGVRLGYCCCYKPRLSQRPLEIFILWHGGMASHGGIIV